MYDSKDDGAMITVTGFDYATFDFLLSLFAPMFGSYTPWIATGDKLRYRRERLTEKRGRPRIVDACACLGLVLSWFRFRGGKLVLQGWFGFTGEHTNAWLRFGRALL
jgi:hypothetical protein